MIRIVDFKARKNSLGEEFFTLILQGNLEMIKSKETGNWYATAKKASVTSTFNEETCKALIGTEMPGSIQKVSVEPYLYTIAETGEQISLEHRWIFVKEGENAEEVVYEGKPEEMEASL